MLNQPWQRVWDRFSINPSRFMGLPTGFAIGDPAEFSLIGTDSEGGIARIETISSSHTGTHH
jgi:dihydroorotase-like cyclic amidohydrolase